MKKRTLIGALLLVCLTLTAQKKDIKQVSIDALLTETQFSSDAPDDLEMVWWLPQVFWEVSFAQDETTTAADIQALKDMFADYELFAVVKGKIGYFGGITYTPLEEIQEILKITYNGQELAMTDMKDIPSDLINFLTIVQPMMSNMLGPMGENMHFIFMENNPTQAVLPINPIGNSPLEIELGTFKTGPDLPLGSLLEEKLCPKDQKMLSGKWTYCPFHGTELKAK
ncbi:MAG: hypothetical protein K0U54_06085 [Bacteroidetes bacterium]|nr:hypothetical protein [Bacteroidota bacterium]